MLEVSRKGNDLLVWTGEVVEVDGEIKKVTTTWGPLDSFESEKSHLARVLEEVKAHADQSEMEAAPPVPVDLKSADLGEALADARKSITKASVAAERAAAELAVFEAARA